MSKSVNAKSAKTIIQEDSIKCVTEVHAEKLLSLL